MMNTRKRLLVGLVVTAGALLFGASMAWACTPQAHISVTPDQAPAGAEVTVNGEQFVSANEIVIRWGDRDSGTELGRARGPGFHENVTIPQGAEPGTYLIWAVDADDSWSAKVSFKVTDPNASTQSGSSGGASGGEHSNANTSGQTSASTSGGDGSTSTGSGSGSQEGSSSQGSTSSESASQGSSSPASSSSGSTSQEFGSSDSGLRGPEYGQDSALAGPNYDDSPESAPQGSPAPEGSASSQPDGSSQAVGEPDRTPSTGGQTPTQSVGQPTDDRAASPQPGNGQPASQPDDGRATPSPSESAGSETDRGGNEAASSEEARAGAEEAAAEDSDDRQASAGDRTGRADTDAAASTQDPSARTGVGDLWSGFDASDGEASLAPSLDGSPADAGDDAAHQLALALGLVGAGLLVLMSGAFLGVARRRALAATSTRPQHRG